MEYSEKNVLKSPVECVIVSEYRFKHGNKTHLPPLSLLHIFVSQNRWVSLCLWLNTERMMCPLRSTGCNVRWMVLNGKQAAENDPIVFTFYFLSTEYQHSHSYEHLKLCTLQQLSNPSYDPVILHIVIRLMYAWHI
jgi:hypothetical protein